MLQLSRPALRAICVSALGVALAAAGAVGWWRQRVDPGRKVRIGYFHWPPFLRVNEDGSAGGLAAEIANVAAARSGVKLKWVLSPQGPRASLAADRVDLWPVLSERGKPGKTIYVSRPWMHDSYVLITLRDSR